MGHTATSGVWGTPFLSSNISSDVLQKRSSTAMTRDSCVSPWTAGHVSVISSLGYRTDCRVNNLTGDQRRDLCLWPCSCTWGRGGSWTWVSIASTVQMGLEEKIVEDPNRWQTFLGLTFEVAKWGHSCCLCQHPQVSCEMPSWPILAPVLPCQHIPMIPFLVSVRHK